MTDEADIFRAAKKQLLREEGMELPFIEQAMAAWEPIFEEHGMSHLELVELCAHLLSYGWFQEFKTSSIEGANLAVKRMAGASATLASEYATRFMEMN